MKFKVFQICFEKSQIDEVDSLLTPFDNTENKHPELREYHNFFKVIDDRLTTDLDAWGLFGPRWNEKLRYSSKEIFDEIEKNSNCDVYLFNHARVQDALTFSVWEQGEIFHKGIKTVMEHVLKRLNMNSTILNDMMFSENTCYCSYFVAKKEFWSDYLFFLSRVKDELENLPENIDKIYKSSANYGRDTSLNLFPFIIERSLSTFLLLNEKKYKVHAKKYDYTLYKNQIGDFAQVIHALNNLKTLTIKYNSQDIFHQWNIIREFILKTQPNLLNVD